MNRALEEDGLSLSARQGLVLTHSRLQSSQLQAGL